MVADLDLYLASESPRRRQLLAAAGLAFELCQPGAEYADGADEHGCEAGDPRVLCVERARRKARGAGRDRRPGVPTLGVDTVVDLAGEELGKAADRDAAAAMLARLAGHTHAVHTAHLLVVDGREVTELVTAEVRCADVSEERLAAYLDTGQWRGKAGGYGIQDAEQDFLTIERGSFDAVVGLHVPAVRRLLRRSREETGA